MRRVFGPLYVSLYYSATIFAYNVDVVLVFLYVSVANIFFLCLFLYIVFFVVHFVYPCFLPHIRGYVLYVIVAIDAYILVVSHESTFILFISFLYLFCGGQQSMKLLGHGQSSVDVQFQQVICFFSYQMFYMLPVGNFL